jgi:acetolactate synthase-1/2/3 large subunit
VARPDDLPAAIAEAVNVLRSSLPGPAFIEIPHDFFLSPVTTSSPEVADHAARPPLAFPAAAVENARQQISASHKPAILVGAGAVRGRDAIRQFAELLQCAVFTTTTGKGVFACDHSLSLGCISRLGAVQDVLLESDLLISFGARLTEFDTGRFGLQLPPQHIQVVEDDRYAGDRLPSTRVVGDLAAIAEAFAAGNAVRAAWCDIAEIKATEAKRLEALQQDGYAALTLLRASLDRKDVLVNDQSILNYWASAFFPVLEPGTFLYPSGSGTLGYGLPAAIGVACAVKQSGEPRKIVCIAGDGGFQYTQHELATLAQYQLPVKILLVNDESYGIIGFLQRTMFGQTHEVALKNPDFCRVAEAYGIRAERIPSLAALQQRIPDWLNAPGPALLEWRTVLKAPWEVGAIPRPTGVAQKSS